MYTANIILFQTFLSAKEHITLQQTEIANTITHRPDLQATMSKRAKCITQENLHFVVNIIILVCFLFAGKPELRPAQR